MPRHLKPYVKMSSRKTDEIFIWGAHDSGYILEHYQLCHLLPSLLIQVSEQRTSSQFRDDRRACGETLPSLAVSRPRPHAGSGSSDPLPEPQTWTRAEVRVRVHTTAHTQHTNVIRQHVCGKRSEVVVGLFLNQLPALFSLLLFNCTATPSPALTYVHSCAHSWVLQAPLCCLVEAGAPRVPCSCSAFSSW